MAGGSQPGIHSCGDGDNFVGASEQEESRAIRKGHPKKRGPCSFRKGLEVCRIRKDK